MNSDLYFEGKRYISSSRAAKISGYVNDYIGQLCRDGKLDARMVGRSWYVGLDSLIEHKNSNLSGTRSKVLKKLQKDDFDEISVFPTRPVVFPKPTVITPLSEFIQNPIGTPAFSTSVAVLPTQHGPSFIEIVSVAARVGAAILTVFVAILGFRFGLAVSSEAGSVYGRAWDAASASLEASALSSLKGAIDSSALAFYEIVHDLLFDTRQTTIVVTNGDRTSVNNANTVSTSGSSRQGMVVVPVDEGTDRAGVVQKIKNTFSDEVSVSPEDGVSGVITPVFKEGSGDDYLYVLVPLGG